MPGGLINLVAQGSADIFLTGAPQITFFKIVYKKYTNFAVENIIIPLEGNVNFDQKSTTNIPKTGDLIYKMYLQVTIPSVQIFNTNKYIDPNILSTLANQLNQYNNLIPKYNSYFNYNFIILKGLALEIKTLGCTWYTVNSLMTSYNAQYASSIAALGLNMIDVITKFNMVFPASSQSQYVGSSAAVASLITAIITFIDERTSYYTQQERTLYENIKLTKDGIANIDTKYEYFAWTDKLGFNLINKCSISLGGVEITSFDSDFLNIYYSLNGNFKQQAHLETMIGNLPALTNYDNLLKPTTTLYVPLPYWFTQHNGSTLPLISLIYHDLEFTIQFNSLDKCCFYNGSININNIVSLGSCALYIDYVYMDVDERKKFAQFSHEYLVQTVQMNTGNMNNIKSLSIDMGFQHPVKEIYWILKESDIVDTYKLYNIYYPVQIYKILSILQPQPSDYPSNLNPTNLLKITYSDNTKAFINTDIVLKYTKYYDGVYKVLYCSADYVIINLQFVQYTDYNDQFYGIIYNSTNNNYFNPINTEYILFNGQERTPHFESNYFNYVVPYQYYNKTPYDGINVLSFSLHPKEYQPSGSCNLSLVNSQTLNINLNQKYYDYLLTNNLNYELSIYAINYNVLRIHHGISTLIFSV